MSLEHMEGEGNTSPEGPTGGVAVAEKPSDKASVLINPEAEIPGSTTTKVRELIKPPSNIWDRFRGRSNIPASPEEATAAEEQTTPEPESEPAASGTGNGAEGRDGGGGDGGNGPEGPRWPERGGESEKDPKFRSREIRGFLQKIDENIQRGEVLTPQQIDDYEKYCAELTVYANEDQVFKQNAAITAEKQKVADFDKEAIKSQPIKEQEEVLEDLLNNYDYAEKRLSPYQVMVELREKLKEEKKPEVLFTEAGWKDQEAQRDYWQHGRNHLEAEIVVRTLTEGERVPLQDVLGQFNNLNNGLVTLENALQNITKKPSSQLSSEEQEQIQNLKSQQDNLLAQRRGIEAQIIANSSQFLKDRQALQEKVEAEVDRLEKLFEEEDKKKENQALGKPDEVETELEEKEEPIRREQLPADLPNFTEVANTLKEQEDYRRTNNPSFNEDIYRQSKEIVGWYFQEAGRLGMLFDLDQGLERELQQYSKIAGLQPVRLGESVQQLTTSELRRLLRSISETKSTEEELDEVWEDITETGRFTQQQQQQFRGIRGEYRRRSYEQMRASLTNLVHLKDRLEFQQLLIKEEITYADYQRKIARIPRDIQTYRVSSEWNFGFEAGERRRMENEALLEGSEKLFDENYFQIKLLGQNRRELELGAEQAAEHIIRSSATYSIEAVEQRRVLLMKAIDDRDTVAVLLKEVGSAEKAQDLVKEIQRRALNKLDFYILQWLSQNLRMDEYSGYFERTVMMEGTDRLKAIPAMHNGLVGMALWYLHKPEYRLYFRPGGFRNKLNGLRNQLDESDAQTYLRNLLEDQLVETLMLFELDDQGKGAEGRTQTLDGLKNVQSTDEFVKKFKLKESTPHQRLKLAEETYQRALKEFEESGKSQEALEKLREARIARAFEQNRFQKAQEVAKNAVKEAVRVMDIFGESSRLGAPSIIMDNGDHISVEEVTLFYKFAILQTDHELETVINGKKYKIQDNQALIRWRSRMWIDAWEKAGLDRTKADEGYKKIVKKEYQESSGQELSDDMFGKLFDLKEGWQETGLTKKGWQALENARSEIRANGNNAEIYGVKFADIIKDPRLLPVLSNFLVDYKSSIDQVNDEYLRTQAAKGRLEAFKNLPIRLELDNRKITGTTQQIKDEYTQRVENSRHLHAELTGLAYYEATHATVEKVKTTRDGRTIYQDSAFSPVRIEYGYQGLPWGIKRAQHRKGFEYTELRRTTQRAVDLIHAIPMSLTSLSQECASDNILDMFWDLKRLQKDDEWVLMTFGRRTKNAWFIGGALEGGIELDKPRSWGFLEKPLTDTNSLWKLFKGKFAGLVPTAEAVERYIEDLRTLGEDEKEEIVAHLFEITLFRFTPIIIGAEKQLSADRQALGSGAGYEENEKFALRFLEWIMSEKPPSEEHGSREEGGVEAYNEVKSIIKLVTAPGSYRAVYKKEMQNGKQVDVLDLEKSSSIWNEVWRKLTPGHNPRLPKEAPEPTYAASAA